MAKSQNFFLRYCVAEGKPEVAVKLGGGGTQAESDNEELPRVTAPVRVQPFCHVPEQPLVSSSQSSAATLAVLLGRPSWSNCKEGGAAFWGPE
jgi:hypothetical protein